MAFFGTNTDGGSTLPANNNRVVVGKYTLSVAANVTAINIIYATDSGTEHAKAVIYSDTAGLPDVLLASSASVTVASGDVTHALTVTLQPGDYWLGSVVDSFQFGWRSASSGGISVLADGNSFASPSNPFGAATTGVSLVSAYATYTAAVVAVADMSQPQRRTKRGGLTMGVNLTEWW